MHRFRKKSETRRPQLIEDLFDFIPTTTASTSTAGPPPALPALSTGLEFRTSLIFPDLTRHFTATGRVANVSESKIRSRLAQQRAHGATERITEEEEQLMFSALNSIQGFRRRGNSTSSVVDASVDLQYPESVSSSKSSGPSLSAFPDTPAVQETSIYPFASLNSQSSTSSSSKRHSNNLFGSSRFRDVTAMRGVQRNRSLSSSTNSQDSTRAAPVSSDNEISADLHGVPEESSSRSPSPSPVEAITTTHQLSDKDKTPTARTSRLPVAPRLPNGNALTVAQIRRMSMALERAISAIVENEHEADDDEERILAPHSVPLGGAYPSRRPPTAFNDPSHPIEVADLNAVLMFLAESEKGRESRVDASGSESNIAAPAPVSRTPGYVPGMNRPISPRDMSGHESEDYSTTPRATSPVTPFGRGSHPSGPRGPVLIPASRRQANGSGRPSTAPTRVGMANNGHSSDWQRQDADSSSPGLERSYSSGQQYGGRYQANDLGIQSSSSGRRRPSSPLSQQHTQISSTGTAFSSSNALFDVSTSISRPAQPGDGNTSHIVIQRNPPTQVDASHHEQEHATDITQGLQREKTITRAMTGPALPDSPLIDEVSFRGYFPPIPAAQSWGEELEPRQAVHTAPTGIFMPQPTAHTPTPRSSMPTILRSQTPNNLAKSGTLNIMAGTPPVARTGTPNYLLQRSPSANGYHLDEHAQETAVRRTISPRPTPSHTPSNSSNSAYNPLMHSSMGSSSRSSIGSAGSSYHSSEGDTNGKHKEVSNWLFDPESKGSVFVSAKNRGHAESEGSSKDDLDSKEDVFDSIRDQEDVLELLTGLTKKDFTSIQQKLVSAAVAKEAEDAIRQSQRRRRPSVQSREFVGSPTPKPITIVNVAAEPEPSIMQLQSPPPSSSNLVKRIQSPAPDRPEPEPEVPAGPPLIVARPLSPVEEPMSDFVDVSEEFKVHSAATTPPELETQEPTPIDQSPRARALAQALFGSEQTSPAVSPPKPSPSVEELQEEVEKKVLAATVALKNPSLNVENNAPLRRKSTKRIDLQKISGPHLVSASMSVDAIPLASPSLASLGASSPMDLNKGGSRIGDRLRRLRGSLRTKSHAPAGHEREPSTSSSVTQEATSSGPVQFADYDPQAVYTPQIRSVPPHAGSGFAGGPPKITSTSPGMANPPASASPAGLKGFITRFRQPKGVTRRDDSSPARPAVSMQPSAFLSSPHLNDSDSTGPRTNARSPMTSSGDVSSRSPGQEPLMSLAQGQDDAMRQLFASARSLGLSELDIRELLEKTTSQTSKQANGNSGIDSRPGTSTQRYEDSSNSSWVTGQLSRTPSRQPSTRARVEATPRARPAREGTNPVSGVVRRTIIYPSSISSASPVPGQPRGVNVQRKPSTTTNNKRRPVSTQSQYSSNKSVHERVPTPPPPRGAAARRASEDGLVPPIPLSPSNGRPSTSAGIISDILGGSSRHSVDDQGLQEDGRALQMVELENGEIIWSVLDTLRDDMEDESRSNYFPSRGSYASHYSGPDDAVQVTFRGLGRSNSRAGNNGSRNGAEDPRPETKVFYSDAREIAHLIGKITNGADYGSFTMDTPASTRSSEDLPVEDQLERLLHRLEVEGR